MDTPQLPKSVGNGSDGAVWVSPMTDAVDIITEKLLDRKTIGECMHAIILSQSSAVQL